MTLSREKNRINNYLRTKKTWPIIVDVQTKEDLSEIKEFFDIGNNKFLYANRFCRQDGAFRLEDFYYSVSNNTDNASKYTKEFNRQWDKD